MAVYLAIFFAHTVRYRINSCTCDEMWRSVVHQKASTYVHMRSVYREGENIHNLNIQLYKL